MKKRAKNHRKTNLAARLKACLVLACLFLPFLGIPFPSGVKKDRSTPFPCQNKSCGCMSAADCKHGCCCFSEDERREWARFHGVDPSKIAPEESSPTIESSSIIPSSKGLIERQHGPCCCHCSNETAQQNLCCEKRDSDEENGVTFLWQARRCHGDDGNWLSFVLVMPTSPICYGFPASICSFITDSTANPFTSRSDEPDDPVAWIV